MLAMSGSGEHLGVMQSARPETTRPGLKFLACVNSGKPPIPVSLGVLGH